MAADQRQVAVQQEPAARVRAAADDQQRGPGGQRVQGRGIGDRLVAELRPRPVSLPPSEMIEVVSVVPFPLAATSSGVPHCEQKRAPSGFSWPHPVQYTLGISPA